ncbi:MAG TPA: deoxyhypusine synthase family protein [Bryobacteraceae bacterium]|jgi:deoxyhypusine synthase|nr:deoxyhypusine synthase family protein [Bryobacteraceae bacterium]
MNNTDERRRVKVRRVDECDTLHDLFTHCLPAFGGAFLRRIYTILDHAVGMGCPMTLAISGPVTVSGQHQAWLIPLLETGWIAYLSTTDAVCYHDGHRSLDGRKNPIFETPIWGDDGALRDERTIRVTDMAFDEDVLLDQDRFLSAVLLRPEFQHKMTGTELRNRLGQFFAAQEKANCVEEGLLATCHRLAIPIFVGAPGDGSVFLNSMKLWAMKKAGLLLQDYIFDLDLHAEIYEACAYHRWGLFDQTPNALATLMLGGGVPKNYNLQPEPALGQILGIPNVRGYNFDVQIVSAPVTDGSLSSCPPGEAVTWGKVDKETYLQSTESMQADYSTVMPFIVAALLENRKRYEKRAAEIGEEKLFAGEPKARGYLRSRGGYRLFENREELCRRLNEDVKANREWLLDSLKYALAGK